MLNHGLKGFVALAGLSATSLYAAQPPNQGAVLTDGFYNTAMGVGSLSSDVPPSKKCVSIATGTSNFYMSGCGNTASGFFALHNDTTGAGNTAHGAGALYANTTGQYNTAVGVNALLRSTSGYSNNALGANALFSNTTGPGNEAIGRDTLNANTSGYYNVAVGDGALYRNTTGGYNIALGAGAMSTNTTGVNNVAVGARSLLRLTTASDNTAVGTGAMMFSTTGTVNVAIGEYALYHAGGAGNTAIGYHGGYALTSGQYNTYVGYDVVGTALENYTTRIGVANSAATTYVAGIANSQLTGTPAQVYVTSNGQLGVLASSERYKVDITPLGATSDRLTALRPVSFHLKADPSGPVQYGLIAEEVDKVYPELVIHDEKGVIQGVRYDELAPMLLNEVQQERATIAAQAARLSELEQRLSDLVQRLEAQQRVAQR